MQRKSKCLPLPNVIARQSVSICMLLQSGVLYAKKSQNNDLFSVFWHFVVVLFAKTIVLYFCRTLHWLGTEREVRDACKVGRRCGISILFLFLIKWNILLYAFVCKMCIVYYKKKKNWVIIKKSVFWIVCAFRRCHWRSIAWLVWNDSLLINNAIFRYFEAFFPSRNITRI